MKNKISDFSDLLLAWNSKENNREMPWKGEKNPYLIWLSEIILQQTRVAQGLAYYLKFKQLFPNINDLANANENKVLKAWEGLGYYSRARNLHFAAKQIVNDFNGNFPNTKKDLLKLKGVGNYTASAIASFAFNLPHAVVDGNVIRVISRVFGVSIPFDTSKGKKFFEEKSELLLEKEFPAEYNQAIMDFGATVCTPGIPNCSNCCMQSICLAFKNNQQLILPVKSKFFEKKNRYFYFLDIHYNEFTYLEQRKDNDIWKNLYQFPLIELTEMDKTDYLVLEKLITEKIGTTKFKIIENNKFFSQTLTHQKIKAKFLTLLIEKPLLEKFELVKRENLAKFAFPKIMNLYFQF